MENPTNVVFEDIRKTLKVELPSYPHSRVILWDQLKAWQSEEIADAKNAYQAGIITLKYLIKEWNFVDTEGKAIPIDENHIGLLNSDDMTFLVSEVSKRLGELQSKKKLSSKK
jgi:hypothetical protein